MIDKNNNITLIFFLLCVIFIVYYYDKHYRNRIKKLNQKIESFRDKNLLSVGDNVKKELSEMTKIKNNFDYLFKDGDIDRTVYVKKKDGKIIDISSTKKEDYNQETLKSVLDTNKLMDVNNDIHKEVKKVDFDGINQDIKNYVQNQRIYSLEKDIAKHFETGNQNDKNKIINSIKNSYNNKTLHIKKIDKIKHKDNEIRYSPQDKDYYIIRVDDPEIYNEILKKNNEIKELGGKWINKTWNIPYDEKKYNIDKEYKIKIDKNKEMINIKIKEISDLNKNLKKALSFDNTNKENPYQLKIYNELDDKSQLMEIHDIELTNGCYNKKTQKFEDIDNTKCKKDLNLELRPNEHKYLCNYNLHVNYPFTIDEKEIEFLPKTFSIIKPINFNSPNDVTKKKSKQQNLDPYANHYMYAFDYMHQFQDNVKTQDDDTYNKECTIKYGNDKNKFKKKEFIESCLTIDKDGLSFQDCNLRKNQRWLTSEKKTYC